MASVVAAPISTDVTATSATAVTTRREVSERGTSLTAARLQHVAGAAHGVDHRLAPGVDLLAQVGDVQLDHVGLAAEVVVPHAVEDLRLASAPGAGCASGSAAARTRWRSA